MDWELFVFNLFGPFEKKLLSLLNVFSVYFNVTFSFNPQKVIFLLFLENESRRIGCEIGFVFGHFFYMLLLFLFFFFLFVYCYTVAMSVKKNYFVLRLIWVFVLIDTDLFKCIVWMFANLI